MQCHARKRTRTIFAYTTFGFNLNDRLRKYLNIHNVPKEEVANNKMQHAYSNEGCQIPMSKQNNILTASCFGQMKYMYIGNRHQRQWWICFGAWATWQCLMGLIRQAAGTGSRLHRWIPSVPLSSVSAGCDLVSRVHCPENWTQGTKPTSIT